ncbi:MAG: transglycosylase domain-containing protein [Patescibacteria group bacterium]
MPIPPLQPPRFRIKKLGSSVSQFYRSRFSRQDAQKKSVGRRILTLWLPILAILVMVCAITGVATFAWFSRDLPDPDKLNDRSVAQSTKIFARDGSTLLYEIHGDQKRTIVNLEDISPFLRDATIAVEDKDFYQHGGFSLPGIAKALCHEAFGNLGGLCPQRGGSTITQQFVKNAILTSDRSYTRKIKELVLSYQLERKFTKDQILKLYLNEIPYGSSAYGAESAAQTFFGKSAKNLSLAESVVLAALPQRPSYLSPYGIHPDELSIRKQVILELMVKQGYATQTQADVALAENTLARLRPKRENILAPHFVMYVKDQLATKYGDLEVEQGGLKIITTLNIDKQRIAEEVLGAQAEKNQKNYRASNAALVSLDTKTGQILAMVGSKDDFDETIDGNVNVALRPRQPGSSFKPFVYMTAFQRGFTPETILFDLVTKFKTDSGKDYAPNNYDGTAHGPLTMRKALAGSLNIPAVKTLYLAGISNVLDNADKFGYTTLTDRSRFGLSLVLGGAEVTLIEHTSAFATLAREGLRHPVTGILRVEDSRGKVLEQYEEREERVMDENTVRLVTSVLSDNDARSYIFGSSNRLTLPDRPVATKTGTTNDYRDAWTLGYTPSIATGVWVGNNDNGEMKRGADGSIVAAPIWQEYMKRTIGGPAEPFKQPKPNSATKPVLRGQLEAEVPIKVDLITGKIIPDSCLVTWPVQFIAEKKFKVAHDILFYVDKSDPNGAVPKNPTGDPEFTRWEEPVLAWAKMNGYVDTKPAMESCDTRAAKNLPQVAITFPTADTTVTTTTFTAAVTAAGPRTVTSVTYLLDGQVIGSAVAAPFTLVYDATALPSGFHDLTAQASDDIGNSGTTTITFNYLPPIAPPPPIETPAP